MDLKCQRCGLSLGDMEKGKLRKAAVLLCGVCWGKAEAAMNVADSVNKEMPDFLKGLFGDKR